MDGNGDFKQPFPISKDLVKIIQLSPPTIKNLVGSPRAAQVNPRVVYGNLSNVPNALRSLIGKGRRDGTRLMVPQQQRRVPMVFFWEFLEHFIGVISFWSNYSDLTRPHPK